MTKTAELYNLAAYDYA